MKKKRDSLMIAATLITGMTFQMAVNPPGGVWDEDKLTSAGASTGTKMLLAGTSIMAYRIHGIQLDVLPWFAKHGVSSCKWGTLCEEKDLDVATYDYHVDNLIIHYNHLQDFYDGHLTRK